MFRETTEMILKDNLGHYHCSDCLEHQIKIKQLQKQLELIQKELYLQQKYGKRPPILKEVIHHPRQPRTSQCLYGIKAWDEYIYE